MTCLLNTMRSAILPVNINVLTPATICAREKGEIAIKWVKPSRLGLFDPKKTGDLCTDTLIDMNKTPKVLEHSKEYATANEHVQRFFTFKFLGRKWAAKYAKELYADKVRYHKYDTTSTEVQIAYKTATIRNLMEHFRKTRDKTAKFHLYQLILKRKKRLRFLRKWDYKSFEWTLEKLDLEYKYANIGQCEFIGRKKAIRKLTEKYCEDYKSKKIEMYKNQLHVAKEDFLKKKLDTLRWIIQEERECGVQPSVTEADVENTERRLTDLLASTMRTEKSKDLNLIDEQ